MALYLIDGTFELYRAFFGAPPGAGRDGTEVGATRGLLRSLTALLTDSDVGHVACAFDQVIESFRNQLFDGYKTGEGIEPALLAQFPLAEAATRALGIVTWPMVEFEADDALATAAVKYADDFERAVICSPDKDLCQCIVDGRVTTLDRIRKTTLDAPGVVAKFGVPPSSIPDYLALVGDNADGIPGVPRWGAKSSAAVLSHYPRLEQIPADVGGWTVKVRGAASLASELNNHRSQALLYRTLATLRRDVPITEDYAQLAYRGPDEPALRNLCAELKQSPEPLLRRLEARQF